MKSEKTVRLLLPLGLQNTIARFWGERNAGIQAKFYAFLFKSISMMHA
jgi:hypothetical protein